jgi:hypothetical protein
MQRGGAKYQQPDDPSEAKYHRHRDADDQHT